MFGSIIDGESMVPAASVADGSVRPSLVTDSSAQFTSNVRKPRNFDRDDRQGLYDRWQVSVRREVARAREFADQFPDSMTALARFADCLFLAGELDEAIFAATKSLRIGTDRLISAQPSDVDVPATYVALQVLLKAQKTNLAREYLEYFKRIPALAAVLATVFLQEKLYDEALELLSRPETEGAPGAAGIKGYALLRKKEYSRAVAQLRMAYRNDPNDVDSILNLAAAFWHLGSTKKAIQWARNASKTAPGRQDAAMALLNYLIEAREFDAASTEVRLLKERQLLETAGFIFFQARIAAGKEQPTKAVTLLKRARTVAQQDGDKVFEAEISGNIVGFEYLMDEIDRVEALQRIRAARRLAPESMPLVAMLADIVNTVSGASEVRRAFEELPKDADSPFYRGLLCRLAYLEGRLDDAHELVSAWVEVEPHDETATRLFSFWHGQLTEDWSGSADRALALLRRGQTTKNLVNAAAYALALAGRGSEALDVLASVDTSGYILKATSGLVYLSLGQIERGMRLYRQAAQLAERSKDASVDSSLMTIHQAMGIRRLGLLDREPDFVRATALPAHPLPPRWANIAEFQFLRKVAIRRGWPWPVAVD